MLQAQSLPSDYETELELKHSEFVHELMKQSWGYNFASPIEKELTGRKDFRVLDVGCGGTGIWLSQRSKDYPLAKFVGLDKSPIFIDNSQDNLQFIQGDILEGLSFDDNFFDLVHIRFVSMEFTEEQWEDVAKELVRVCKPGGWVEILDVDETKHMGPTFKRLISSFLSNLEYKGIGGPTLSEEMSEILYATDQIYTIYSDERLIPVGNWGGVIGKLALESLISLFRICDSVKWLGVSDEEFEIIIKRYEEELEQYHSLIISRRHCCQKKR